MKLLRRLSIFLILTLILGLLHFTPFPGWGAVFAQVIPFQPAPERLRVEAMYSVPPGIQPPLGYNEYDGYYVDLKWDSLRSPEPDIAENKYMNFYLQEVSKPYKPPVPAILKEENVPANPGSPTALRMKNLSPGTIYYTYATAWYTYTEQGTILKSAESAPSNTVKFLTDIELAAYSHGIKQIKIIWDDVWESGRRIDYKLYISEDSGFANTPPIYIRQEDIGPGRPVNVNESEGKLEYIYNVRDAGRVYYIKIAPDISDPGLKHSEESNVVAVSSFILAKTTKVASTEAGSIWKIEWSPVVTGLGSGDIKTTYHIYRGILDSSDIPQYVAAVDDTVFFTTLMPEDESRYYFIIRAFVTRNGMDVYPGVKIESDKIIIQETGAPYTPAAPLLVDKFEDRDGRTIISYDGELKHNSATILWKVPETGDGKPDAGISYDMWLINDPNLVDSPPESSQIASSVVMGDANKVMDENKLLGYKYTISNLAPNTAYYLVVAAKKTFIDYEGEYLREITLSSEPSIKVILTPPVDIASIPVAPGRPPLMVKTYPGRPGIYMVTETTAVIRLMDKWYEEYNHDTGKWEYRTPGELGEEIVNDLEAGTAGGDYRVVQYDSGVSLDVGCVEYGEDISYSDIASMPANKVAGFPASPNDPYEDALSNPDGKKHNIDIILSGLAPNTSYIIWVRAARVAYGLVSAPSDPLIVTTAPHIPIFVEKPTVPSFNYYYPGDTFVDLGWNFKAGCHYNIKYGTEDDINTAKGTVEVKPEDMFSSAFYRVKGLEQEKTYYFWIQAVSVGADGSRISSDWSDSIIVKTLPHMPPETPQGFGIMNTRDAVTENSISFEWIMEDEVEYILEIAENADYSNPVEYNAGKASGFRVENLRSNYVYYARLYAYDSAKNLRSAPTYSVVCRTRKSIYDYDSGEYTEDLVKGDYVIKEYIQKDSTWNVRIEGINADRFIESVMNDRVLDYVLDVTGAPPGTKRIVISISARVFDAMGQLKENIIILNKENQIIIRPGIFGGANAGQPYSYYNNYSYSYNNYSSYNSYYNNYNNGYNYSGYNYNSYYNSCYEIAISYEGDANSGILNAGADKGIDFITGVTGLKIELKTGQLRGPVYKLGNPLRIVYSLDGRDWFIPGITDVLTYDAVSSTWGKAGAEFRFNMDLDKSCLAFDMPAAAGSIAVGNYRKDKYDNISSSMYREAINKVASAHELKSAEGNLFYVGRDLSLADGVKFILDVMDYNYGNNFLEAAFRAGIIDRTDMDSPAAGCTREKALFMAARLYELKTGERAKPSGSRPYPFKDMDKISPHLADKVKFAIENGFMSYRISDMLEPGSVVMRGEFMGILEKVLEACGEF